MKYLVFNIGSLGDSIIGSFVLDKLNLNSDELTLLTNTPAADSKIVSSFSIFSMDGKLSKYLVYPRRWSIGLFIELISVIRSQSFDRVIYLMPTRNFIQLLRDFIFFYILCGIRSISGIHFSIKTKRPIEIEDGLYEHEASRLMRQVGISFLPMNIDKLLDNRRKFDINPIDIISGNYLVASIGTKAWVNDWGDEAWSKLLSMVSQAYPNLGLVWIGSSDEFERCEDLSRNWLGNTYNACGMLSLKESLGVLASSKLYIGHDSGPIHLAAEANIPIVGIYSARNPKGVWYPLQDKSIIHYSELTCGGCFLTDSCPYNKKCIRDITEKEVFNSVKSYISREYN